MSLYIESPITGEQIQVAENDFSDRMTWDQAMSACEGLGNGWRLPNKEEFEVMYEHLHTEGKGNFKDSFPEFQYWSSSEIDADNAWYFNFEDGIAYYSNGKNSTKSVRAVRTLP